MIIKYFTKTYSDSKLTEVDGEKLLTTMLANYDKLLLGAIKVGMEARMTILEDQKRQLKAKIERLKQLKESNQI